MEIMAANGKWRRKERVTYFHVRNLVASNLVALKSIPPLLTDPHDFHLKISTPMFLTITSIILIICLKSEDAQEPDLMC